MEWTTERPTKNGWYFYQTVNAAGDEGPIRVGYICYLWFLLTPFTAVLQKHDKALENKPFSSGVAYELVANMEDDAKEANAVLRWAGPIDEPTSITD